MAFSIGRNSVREQAEQTLDEGLEFLGHGKEQEAGRYFFKSIEIDPTYADGHNHLGNIAWRKGDWKQAEALYRKALQFAEPEVKNIPKGGFWGILESRPYMRALHGLGLTAWKDGRIDDATSIFKRMLKLNPNDNQGIRYLMGPLFHQKGDLEGASRWYRKNSDDPHTLYNYGLALIQQDMADMATEILIFAISSNPYVPPILLGRKLPKRDWWHSTGWAEAEYAQEYVTDYGSWWEKGKPPLVLLEVIWNSAEVQLNLKTFIRLRRAMKKARSGEERVYLGRASDELWNCEKVRGLAGLLYERFKVDQPKTVRSRGGSVKKAEILKRVIDRK